MTIAEARNLVEDYMNGTRFVICTYDNALDTWIVPKFK
jgi:hypothetical protein